VIDDCDYYIVIIGGRYGSLILEDASYTEKKYDYAVEKEMRVMAFLHDRPEEIPLGKSEGDPKLREKLSIFRDRVATGRLVKFWSNASELPGLVALSVPKTIKSYPAVGWIRADQVRTASLLNETKTSGSVTRCSRPRTLPSKILQINQLLI